MREKTRSGSQDLCRRTQTVERNERFQLALYALRAEVECENGFPGPATSFLGKAESLTQQMKLDSDSEVNRLIKKVQHQLSATTT